VLPGAPVLAAASNRTSLEIQRDVPISIKIVFVGIGEQDVDLDYLRWNLPEKRYQLIAIPGTETKTTYSLTYSFEFASPEFADRFALFLDSTGKVETRTNVLWNETYSQIDSSYFLNYTHFRVNATNTYYSADDAETWLLEHAAEYGGLLANGYTLVLINLSNRVPSVTPSQFQTLPNSVLTPHFFNKTFVDHDLGIKLNRRFMTAWGGHARLFFIDLSAGPGPAAEQLPLQLAAWVNNITPLHVYWSTWLTQYVSDYVQGAVYNIFLPDLVYPISYAEKYNIQVVVIDNRTVDSPRIEETVDSAEVQRQLESLLPFAQIEVNTQFIRLEELTRLAGIVRSATSPSKGGILPIVDARPVYYWFSQSGEGHISEFSSMKRSAKQYDIPVLVFAFEGNYSFGFTFKEFIAEDWDVERAIWGVALYEFVLISHSATDLRRGDFTVPEQPGMGFGFTNTIIHEVGHMVGLMHPFATAYDPTENFVSSVMAYYPYEDEFSQFDKDALLRAQADQTIRAAIQLLRSTPFAVINWPETQSAMSNLDQAERAYERMDYLGALKAAHEGYQNALTAQLLAGGGALTNPSVVWAVGLFAFLAGSFVSWILVRRRTLRSTGATVRFCSNCGGKVAWIQQYQRWYCYRCQRYEASEMTK